MKIKSAIKRLFVLYANNTKRKNLENDKLLCRVLGKNAVYNISYVKFFNWMMNDFDNAIQKLLKNKKIMIIERGKWSNLYFNVACLGNTIKQIAYALYNGCIPVIKINDGEIDKFQWQWFFKQPVELLYNGDYSGFDTVTCDKKSIEYALNISWTDYITKTNVNYKIWNFLYEKFLVLNEETENYIKREKTNINISDSKVLGVLVRGTDYTATKPKWHPVQPTVDEVIEKVSEFIVNKNYDKIYLATEEEKVYNIFCDKFGKENVLVNNRTYYDSIYKDGMLIGEVHFDRKDDNYQKSIEYLSSLIILSECDGLVAGNCGGTAFALIRTKKFNDVFVFDKGLY